MSHPRATLDDTLANVRDWFQGHFDELTAFSAALTSELHLDAHGLLNMTDANRRRMKATSTAFLAEHPVVDGCGLIFAHSALGTDNGRLEWWVREEESRFARYSFGVVPGADRYYDYEQHEWFQRAFFEGARAAVGPYIDYLGVESYVVTITVPAEVDGRRVGAVGNDLLVGDLEATLMPILRACDHEVVILNRHGNVIVSNSAAYLPGELVAQPPEGTNLIVLDPLVDSLRLLHSVARAA
ncbi:MULTISPECIES: cache domain-containing protein [unclassified Leucobacter]|uniref:cache domain-containing protein n=1 Tax=unclassified Leucobacter TaxID=2621730 RepID=UPI00165DCB42|nr:MULTISPECIES: cache domain-containing protein [unclassified Leucobacter]MBC9926628.1 PDC sensor domain-containing protein [Leucobacter sp. cx-169]